MQAFIVTGGAGALGGAVAKEIIAKGGYAIIFDMVPEAKGKEIVSAYHDKR